MYPAIHILGRNISTYGLATVAGVGFAFLLLLYTPKKRGVERMDMMFFAIYALIGAFIGAKLLYGMMVHRMELSLKNGWLDRNGKVYIYFTVDEVKDKFHCANDKAMKLIRELDSEQGIGLIECVRQGLGKPNFIYVKNFVSGSQV